MEITSEELFDILHSMGNEVEKEWHAIENGALDRAQKARSRRHELLSYILPNKENPQLLCEVKHTISVRTEWMELAEKFNKKGNQEMEEKAKEKLDELGQEIIELLHEVSGGGLNIKA